MRLKTIIAVFVFLSLCGGTVQSQDIYVSPAGNDVNPGTIDRPLRSLEAARDALRETDRSVTRTVWLRSGIYQRERMFLINEKDSGRKGARVVFRGYPGEDVRIVGGKRINPAAFVPVTDEKILQRLDGAAKTNVVQADLKLQGITDYGKHAQYGHALPVVPAPLELFFNDECMQLARYPNEGFIKIGKVIDTGSIPRIRNYKNIRGGTFEYTDSRHEWWAGIEDVWLQGTFNYGYADDKIKIKSIDTEKKTVTLSTPHMYGLGSGAEYQHYIALNILDELDYSGEWYVDRETGILYFWPPSSLKSGSIFVSLLEDPVISLEGASYVTIRDITVEVSRGIGIYIERGEHNLIAGCTVRNIGTSGIFMGQGARQTFPHITHDDYDGVPISRQIGNLQGQIYKYTTWDRKAGKNHTILSCDVYNTGCGGIYLSGGRKKDLIAGNCSVINCKVHDYNRRNKFLWSGINIDGCGNKIAHCEIYNSDFQGIYAHGNDHIFEYNNIHDVVRNSDDTSPWYMGRDPSDRGNILRYNFFHHIGRLDRMNMGIYNDDNHCGTVAYGNILFKVNTNRGTVYSNGGSDIHIKNNIFIDCPVPVVEVVSMFYDWGVQHRNMFFPGGEYYRRCKVLLNIKKPPYSERYPELVDHLDPVGPDFPGEIKGMRPRRNILEGNLIVRCGEPVKMKGEYAQFDSRNNFVTADDPGFVSYDDMDFTLRDDSAVFKKIPGFPKIPFKIIGLYEDEYRHLSKKKN